MSIEVFSLIVVLESVEDPRRDAPSRFWISGLKPATLPRGSAEGTSPQLLEPLGLALELADPGSAPVRRAIIMSGSPWRGHRCAGVVSRMPKILTEFRILPN